MTDTNILDELFSHPTTAQVFLLLHTQNEPMGVREIQRKLDLGSPSTAYWHLNKLKENGVIMQLPSNEYQLEDQYQEMSDVKLPVSMNYQIIGRYVIPKMITPVFYLIVVIISMVVFVIREMYVQAAFTGLFGLVATLFLVLKYLLGNLSILDVVTK